MATDRSAFHEERRSMIGGSDAAAVMGLSRWRTPMDVWAEKIGLVEADDEAMALRQWIGIRLEPLIAEMATARLGRPFRRRSAVYRSRRYPFIGGHVDFVQLEAKTSYTSEGFGPDGSEITADDRESWDALPIDYLLQTQHYLYVTRWPLMTVAVLIGHDDFRTYAVRPVAALIKPMVEEEVRFWHEHVVTGSPPPLDASEGTKAYLRSRYPRAFGDIRVATPEETQLIEAYREASIVAAAAEKAHETAKARLENAIGTDLGLRAPGVSVRWPTIERKPDVNWELVAAAYRHIIETARESPEIVSNEPGVESLDSIIEGADLNAVQSLYTLPGKSYRRLSVTYTERR